MGAYAAAAVTADPLVVPRRWHAMTSSEPFAACLRLDADGVQVVAVNVRVANTPGLVDEIERWADTAGSCPFALYDEAYLRRAALAALRQRATFACEICGKEREARTSDTQKPRTCSPACRQKLWRQQKQERELSAGG